MPALTKAYQAKIIKEPNKYQKKYALLRHIILQLQIVLSWINPKFGKISKWLINGSIFIKVRPVGFRYFNKQKFPQTHISSLDCLL